MRIQKFGHCCLVVECEGVRLLIDPGVFSTGFEELRDLTAVLITHVHQDHLDVDRVRVLMAHNVQASVLCDELSAVVLAEQAVTGLVVRGDERIDLGVQIRVYANRHAVIHPDVPNIPNMGYSIAGRFFYGGETRSRCRLSLSRSSRCRCLGSG